MSFLFNISVEYNLSVDEFLMIITFNTIKHLIEYKKSNIPDFTDNFSKSKILCPISNFFDSPSEIMSKSSLLL